MGALQQQVLGQGKSQVIPSCSMLASQILAEADQIAPRKNHCFAAADGVGARSMNSSVQNGEHHASIKALDP